MRAWVAVCLLLVGATARAQCPSTREFRAWVDEISSSDPLVQLGTALTQPPQADGTVVDAECLRSLLATEDTRLRGLLIASLAEASVAEAEFIEIVARDLGSTDEKLAAHAAIALSRRGLAAIPVLLGQLRAGEIVDVRLASPRAECNRRRLPWARASLALERMRDAAVPALFEFVASEGNLPVDPCDEPETPRTSLSFALSALGRSSPESLGALYEARPALATGPDRAAFMQHLFESDGATVDALLTRHPELIVSYLQRRSSLNEPRFASVGPAATPALLAALTDDDAETQYGALGTLLSSSKLVGANEIHEPLVDGLRSTSSHDYVDLVMSIDVGAFVDDDLAADVGSMLGRGPLDVQLAAWKILRDFGRADVADLRRILLAAVDAFQDDPTDADDFLDVAGVIIAPIDPSELLAGLPEEHAASLRWMIDVSTCRSELRHTAAALAETSVAALGPNLALAFANHLYLCAEGYHWGLYVDDETEAREEFWSILYDALPPQEFAALALRISSEQPQAGVESAFENIVATLVKAVPSAYPYEDEWMDPVRVTVPATRLLRDAAQAPAFVAHLKRSLDTPVDFYPPDYAALLQALDQATSDDIAVLVEQLSEPDGDEFEIRDAISALILLEEPGAEALDSLMRGGPIEVRTAIIDALAHHPSPRVADSLAYSLNDEDQQVRAHAMRTLLTSGNVTAAAEALRLHPADVPALLALLQTDAAVPYAATFVDAIAGNRAALRIADSTLRGMVTETISGVENYPGSLVIAALLNSRSRRLLERSLDDPCLATRADALTALIRAARGPDENRRVLDLLRQGVPSRRSGAPPRDECPPNGRRYPSFADETELAAGIAAAGVESAPLLRGFLEGALADGTDLADMDGMFWTTLWAVDELERSSSSQADRDAVDGVLRHVLRSDCDECQVAIESVLARRPRGAQIVVAAAAERHIAEYVDIDRYDSSLEEITVTGSRISSVLPHFELWGPSDRMELPERFVASWTTFQDAADDLIEALDNAGYDRHGLFSVDEGIVLVTGLEQTRPDGTSLPVDRRWVPGDVEEPRSIGDYVARLFLGESGNYRMIAFVIAPRLPPIAEAPVLAEAAARGLYLRGETSLPQRDDELTAGSRCFVLVYEYERRRGEVVQHVPGANTALFHLRTAGILESLDALR